ncbi:MAG: transcriptional repressor NrdR [Pirellulales bacterium]|nr:transcriptional repressor NrdR [Pirellulales bacterium]
MKCPYCGMDNDRVIDSRASQDGRAIRRRRQCARCDRRFTSYEIIEEPSLKVIKKGGARVPYVREKIKQGIERACWKRPISTQQIESIVESIENAIYTTFSEVESQRIGDMVLEHLRELDHVAFVRFASVYRKFDNLNDFVDTLRPMLAEAMKRPK